MDKLDLDSLSIEQKVGQMFLAREPRNQSDKDYILGLVRDCALGGIHTKDPAFAAELRAAASYPLLICENMENGYEKSAEIHLPSPMAIGATGSEEYAYQFGRLTALAARRDGYNLVFGPIFDLAMTPAACCVGPRAFGAGRELVASMATAAVRGYQEHGMVVTAKHYPGFGASPVDSHLGMVVIDADKELLIERELYPYLHAMREAGLSGVMTGHIMVPQLDPQLPASLSPRLIGLLRSLGYDGLIMTDSLAMVGLTNRFGLADCHVMAMQAGNDMVMTSYRLAPRDGYKWMLDAAREGRVDPQLVDSAVRRVLAAQQFTMQGFAQEGYTAEDLALPRRMAEAAVCVSDGNNFRPLDSKQRHLCLVQVANSFVSPRDGSTERDVVVMDPDNVESLVKERFPAAEFWRINEYPSRSEMEAASSATMGYDSVILLAFSRTEHYAGSSDLTKRMLALLDGLGPKLKAVVLRGNPHAARELPSSVPVVFAFDGIFSEEAALDVLSGTAAPQGHLPV